MSDPEQSTVNNSQLQTVDSSENEINEKFEMERMCTDSVNLVERQSDTTDPIKVENQGPPNQKQTMGSNSNNLNQSEHQAEIEMKNKTKHGTDEATSPVQMETSTDVDGDKGDHANENAQQYSTNKMDESVDENFFENFDKKDDENEKVEKAMASMGTRVIIENESSKLDEPTDQNIDQDIRSSQQSLVSHDQILSAKNLATESMSGTVTRRRLNRQASLSEDIESNRNVVDEEKERLKKVPHFERRKCFNIAKYIISIVLIVFDIIFDWVEYSEMNSRGNYSIVAERQVDNVKVTFECEGTGSTIQLVYLIFTVIGTVLSVGQIVHIIYITVHEFKGTKVERKIINEVLETFVFILFIEISQLLLIMGFFDVCKLDCTIEVTKVLSLTASLISIFKISWRFSTSFRCCTVVWVSKVSPEQHREDSTKRPRPPTIPSRSKNCPNCSCSCVDSKCLFIVLAILLFPIWLPFLPCICIYQACKDFSCKQCMACERNCSCCILRCCPSALPVSQTDACSCRCGECMSCEQYCKCFTVRCCPSYLIPPKSDILTCSCRECLACECFGKCFICRCFPTFLKSPKFDIWTCLCAQCLSCALPCKCCICRCFPEHIGETEWWECHCTECLSCALPCKCCIYRCFPEHIDETEWWECHCTECLSCACPCYCFTCRCFPEHQEEDDWFTCRCTECLSCELPCKCCTCRCFPEHKGKTEWFECSCKRCLACEQDCEFCTVRCCPSALDPPEDDICECCCCEPNEPNVVAPAPPPPIPQTVQIITIQPRTPTPPPPPPRPRPITIIIPPPRIPSPPKPKRPRCQDCISCLKNCSYFLLALLILLDLLLIFVYISLAAVFFVYLFFCDLNVEFIENSYTVFVRSFVNIFI